MLNKNKLLTMFPALAKGVEVADPVKIKALNTAQSTITAFLSMVAFVAVSYGYVSDAQAQELVMLLSSLWVVLSSLYSAVSTIITSKRIGI
jgi:hypothetical protein